MAKRVYYRTKQIKRQRHKTAKNVFRKTTSFVLAFLIVFQTIAGIFLPVEMTLTPPYVKLRETRAAGESWYDASWTRRKAVTVTENSGSTLINYQVKITVAYDSDMQADFDDIRFTDENGSTLIDHWLESKTDSTTADFWVEIPTLTASQSKTIYMYYGNPSAASASNGANTFPLFDDFSTAGDLSKWTGNTEYASVSGGIMTFDPPLNDDAYDLRTVDTFPQGSILKSRTKITGTNSIFGFANGFPGVNRVLFYHSPTQYTLTMNVGTQTATTAAFTIGSYVNYRIDWSSNVNFYYDGTITSSSPHTANIPTANIPIQIYSKDPAIYVDWVFVRKYASQEPTASVGSEEYFDHFVVTGTGAMNAGASQVITITAKTNLGNTWGYTGDKSLTFSGANVSAGGNNPTCSDKTSADVNFGTAAAITFTSGVATSTMKLYAAESVSIDVTDGTVNSTGDPSYDLDVVVSSPLSGMSIQINSNDVYTISKDTTLTLAATNASWMKFSNDNSAYSAYEAYAVSKSWDITNATYGGTFSEGTKTVYAKYKDAYGNEAAAVNDNIVYDTTVPVNPTSAVDAQGAVSDTWQNNKNDPNFTSFTGESDTNGVVGFYVYFGVDAAGTTTDWIATDVFNPASFLTSGARYLRVLTRDNPGNWADPDGVGTACPNTNASRPADPDCWATIFIHKYDIDAPNTPSPSVSPVSWTNTNSFNFSWSDPGDIGSSGVKDYTYQTNAGTSPTITASASVNSLTSDSNGTKLFSVKANDNAGNSGSNGTVNFYYDNTAPTNAGAATDGNGSLDDTWGTVSDPNFTWGAGSDISSGVKEYDVYWGTSASGTTVIATVATNVYNPAAIPANTLYYLRIRTRDNALNESAWATIFTMKYSQAASSPSGLSQTANAASLALGDWTNDTAPILNFTLTDPDTQPDTLGYIIKIDNNSDFASPEVFYTYPNTLISGNPASFTVGQAAGTGTYTNGSQGQTLAEGQYYWKIQAIESHNLASSEVTANSGAAAFGVDASNPTGATLGFGTIAADSITVTVSGASDSVSGLHVAPYYFENTTAATNSGWQAGTSWASGSLSPNTQYTFKVTARDKAGNTQETATQSKYTLANVPSSLTLASNSQTQITASWSANSNSAGTEYYIENMTAGTNSGWTTSASWASANLSCSTNYFFKVKAKNEDGTATAFTDLAGIATQNCGGGMPPAAFNPPALPKSVPENPEGKFSITIDDGNEYTTSEIVKLKFYAGEDTKRMAISNTPDFSSVSQVPYQETIKWDLTENIHNSQFMIHDSKYIVYAKFYTSYGVSSPTVSDSIILDAEPPEIKASHIDSFLSNQDIIIAGFTEPDGKIGIKLNNSFVNMPPIFADSTGYFSFNLGHLSVGSHTLDLRGTDSAGNMGETLSLNLIVKKPELAVSSKSKPTPSPALPKTPTPITSIPSAPTFSSSAPIPPVEIPLLPAPPASLPTPSAEPTPAPQPLNHKWNLLPTPELKEFPLPIQPNDISFFTQKFPSLTETFKNLNISQIEDIGSRAPSASFNIPSLFEILNIQSPKDIANQVKPLQPTPLVDLPVKLKQYLRTFTNQLV